MILDQVERLIADHGLAVMGIFPDLARGLPALNYTVGLQDFGLPEIVLTGVDAQTGITILNQVADWLKARGEPPADGEILAEGFMADGYQARFRALSVAEVEENLRICNARNDFIGRDPPQAFQIVYQDAAKRWPEDPAYENRVALMLAQSEKETKQ
jgi:hypothetical protein